MPLLVDCPVHGPQVAYGFVEGNAPVRLKGVGATCPVPGCGRQGPVIDGDYMLHGAYGWSARLQPTPAQARRLLTAAQWAQRQIDANADQAQVAAKLRATAEKEAPALLRVVDAMTSTRGAGIAAWIAILLAVIQMCISGQQHQLSEEDVARIVEEVHQADQQREASSESPRPSPTPTAAPEEDGATPHPSPRASEERPRPARPSEPPRSEDSRPSGSQTASDPSPDP